MYNKLFAHLLDSSIWLESNETRVVWITLLAAMDEEGFAQFAAPQNVADRARVPLEETKTALRILESPDEYSSDPENAGRRIERVPGGWIILNATKYRNLVTREESKRRTRERVRRFREKQKNVTLVTPDNGTCNAPVTQSEAYTEAETNLSLQCEGKGGLGGNQALAVVTPADAVALARKPRNAQRAKETDEEWLSRLCRSDAYAGIDVRNEYARAGHWAETNGRILSRRFFQNWINRVPKPLQIRPQVELPKLFSTTGKMAGNAAVIAHSFLLKDKTQ